MTNDILSLLTGDVLEEDVEMTLAELCRACQVSAETVFELVDEGVVEPMGQEPAIWHFHGINVRRVRCVQRLQNDLGVNIAGAALALELLEELEVMRERLRRIDN
ncbi:MAG: MerR family transcriptional regulator [Gammaproteobacteria bacterium]|nr:MAG: MerR family transcriptional regulator [Gammaproteobacteria bacterium]